MAGFDQIVVAIGSPGADCPVIAYAALLARLGAAKDVRFVHVADTQAPAADVRREMRDRIAVPFREIAARTECDVLQGSLTDRLLAYVTEFQADLAVIGGKRRKLGSRLAMVAPCAVAVVPNHHPARLSHVMVAVDFSSAALETLQWVTQLAAGAPGTRCTALHVATPESTDLFGAEEDEAQQAEAMRRLLAEADCHGVDVEPRRTPVERSTDIGLGHHFSIAAAIEGSDVAHTIIAEAERSGADCIALGTRGRSRSASILLGSVTEKVIERSNVPVLIGKHGGAHLSLGEILLGRAGWQPGIKTN
ncbi:MAG: universal stress protein [Vicinamibacterales bacterium]